MTNIEDAPPYVEIINGAMEFTMPPVYKMGVEAVEVRRGYAKTKVPVDGNGNHFGVIYAGVQFTVAEILGGAIAVASFDNSEFYPLVKEMNVKFVGMAKSDLTAEVTMSDEEIERVAAEATEKGKSDYVLEAEVKNADGKVVATTRGVYQLRAHGK